MTAYGRSTISLSVATFVVEITSVNRKNLDLSLTLPREWQALEIDVRKWVIEFAKRGSIIIKIARETNLENQNILNLDLVILKQLKEEISALQIQLDLKQSISFEFLLELASKMKGREIELTEEEIEGPIKEGVLRALKAWNHMRDKEGQNLYVDLDARVKSVKSTIEKIEHLAPLTAKVHEEKLRKKLIDSKFFQEGDFERICKEVLIFSDKIDITEEITRLRSHLDQFLIELKSSEHAVGKKLDFLMQEMHREANSLGVKCQDLEIIQLSVLIKSELEKIREQVQNIE